MTARLKASIFLPPLQSMERQTHEVSTNSIKDLDKMIDKVHIDENAKGNTKDTSIKNNIAQKEIMEIRHDFKKMTTSLYDIDNLTFQELQDSLHRIKDDPKEPFSFLTNISKGFVDEDHLFVQARKPTEIDVSYQYFKMQLAAVAKRIESSKILLDEAKCHIKDIHRLKNQDLKVPI